MSFLDLYMADAVAFLVFCDLIGTEIILHIWELICLYIFLYNPISLLCRSIIFLPNMLLFFHNTFLMHSSDNMHAPVEHNQFQNHPLPM